MVSPTVTYREGEDIVMKRKIMMVLSISMLIGLWFTGSLSSQESQLIARWPLDENSGSVVHDVIGGNDGERVGGPEWVPAKFGSGLQFSKKARQYINIPRTPELEPAESLTVMVWVNVNSAAGRQEIFCYGDSYVILINNGVFKAYIHKGGAFPRAPGKTPVETDRWYFLAMTYDSQDLKLYVNGKLDGSARLPGGIDFLGLPLRFSNNPAAPAEVWEISGILDEVELWDTAMTEEEIMKAYESPLAFLAVSWKGKLPTAWGVLKSCRQ